MSLSKEDAKKILQSGPIPRGQLLLLHALYNTDQCLTRTTILYMMRARNGYLRNIFAELTKRVQKFSPECSFRDLVQCQYFEDKEQFCLTAALREAIDEEPKLRDYLRGTFISQIYDDFPINKSSGTVQGFVLY